MIELTTELIITLFLLAVFAGLMDTLVGGGGLITVPGLMLTGLPPVAVLATNKLQGCSGTMTASMVLFRGRHLDWNSVKQPMLMAALGATIGVLLVRQINAEALSFIIPTVLIIIAGYFLISPLLKSQASFSLSSRVYRSTLVPIIGCYDGMLGPGTGSFYAMAGTAFQKLSIIESVKQAKALNFATNAASLTIFASMGEVVWHVGLVMVAGQILGAGLGAKSLIKINPSVLRPGIVAVCIIMLIAYFYHL